MESHPEEGGAVSVTEMEGRIVRTVYQGHSCSMQETTADAGTIDRREVAKIYDKPSVANKLLHAKLKPPASPSATSVVAALVASLSPVSGPDQSIDLHQAGLGVLQLLHVGLQYTDALIQPDKQLNPHSAAWTDQAVMLRTAYGKSCEDLWRQYLVSSWA